MMTSQYCMLAALALLLFAWGTAWARGHRCAALQQVFAALVVQALAAIGLSFSGNHLALSLVLAAVILAAVGWMARSAARLPRSSH